MKSAALWARYWVLWLLSFLRIGTEALYRLAVAAYAEDIEAVSVRSLDRAVEISSRRRGLDFACDLGDLQFDQQDFAAASLSYQKALDEDDNHPRALRGMGLTLHAMGLGSEAVYYYVSFLRHEPNDIDVVLNLALALIWAGRFDDADERIGDADKLAPGAPAVRETRAEFAYARGDIEEGIEILQGVLTDFPERCEARRVLGVYLQTLGRMEEAGALYQRALECDEGSPTLQLALASFYLDLNDGASMVRHAGRAVELLQPMNAPEGLAQAYTNMAWGYYLLGDLAKSIEANGKAVALSRSLWSARADLALAQLCNADVDAARENYELFVQMATDASEPLVAIEDLQEAMSACEGLDVRAAEEMMELLRARGQALTENARSAR